jgi:hypothetical protein
MQVHLTLKDNTMQYTINNYVSVLREKLHETQVYSILNSWWSYHNIFTEALLDSSPNDPYLEILGARQAAYRNNTDGLPSTQSQAEINRRIMTAYPNKLFALGQLFAKTCPMPTQEVADRLMAYDQFASDLRNKFLMNQVDSMIHDNLHSSVGGSYIEFVNNYQFMYATDEQRFITSSESYLVKSKEGFSVTYDDANGNKRTNLITLNESMFERGTSPRPPSQFYGFSVADNLRACSYYDLNKNCWVYITPATIRGFSGADVRWGEGEEDHATVG